MDLENYNARWLAAWTAKDADALMTFYADDVTYFDAQVPQGLTGAAALRTYLGQLFPAIPDVTYVAETLWEIPGGFCARWYGSVGTPGAEMPVFRGFDLVLVRGDRIAHNEVYTHQLVSG